MTGARGAATAPRRVFFLDLPLDKVLKTQELVHRELKKQNRNAEKPEFAKFFEPDKLTDYVVWTKPDEGDGSHSSGQGLDRLQRRGSRKIVVDGLAGDATATVAGRYALVHVRGGIAVWYAIDLFRQELRRTAAAGMTSAKARDGSHRRSHAPIPRSFSASSAVAAPDFREFPGEYVKAEDCTGEYRPVMKSFANGARFPRLNLASPAFHSPFARDTTPQVAESETDGQEDAQSSSGARDAAAGDWDQAAATGEVQTGRSRAPDNAAADIPGALAGGDVAASGRQYLLKSGYCERCSVDFADHSHFDTPAHRQNSRPDIRVTTYADSFSVAGFLARLRGQLRRERSRARLFAPKTTEIPRREDGTRLLPTTETTAVAPAPADECASVAMGAANPLPDALSTLGTAAPAVAAALSTPTPFVESIADNNAPVLEADDWADAHMAEDAAVRHDAGPAVPDAEPLAPLACLFGRGLCPQSDDAEDDGWDAGYFQIATTPGAECSPATVPTAPQAAAPTREAPADTASLSTDLKQALSPVGAEAVAVPAAPATPAAVPMLLNGNRRSRGQRVFGEGVSATPALAATQPNSGVRSRSLRVFADEAVANVQLTPPDSQPKAAAPASQSIKAEEALCEPAKTPSISLRVRQKRKRSQKRATTTPSSQPKEPRDVYDFFDGERPPTVLSHRYGVRQSPTASPPPTPAPASGPYKRPREESPDALSATPDGAGVRKRARRSAGSATTSPASASEPRSRSSEVPLTAGVSLGGGERQASRAAKSSIRLQLEKEHDVIRMRQCKGLRAPDDLEAMERAALELARAEEEERAHREAEKREREKERHRRRQQEGAAKAQEGRKALRARPVFDASSSSQGDSDKENTVGPRQAATHVRQSPSSTATPRARTRGVHKNRARLTMKRRRSSVRQAGRCCNSSPA